MRPVRTHGFDVTPEEARRIQAGLAPLVIERDAFGPVRYVAGADAHYDEGRGEALGAVAVLDADTLQVVDTVTARVACTFPYVPHLLSFRELPGLMAALEKLRTPPDLIVCDGQGRAHARRLGIASHLGVLFDVATIGCAKSRLTGSGPPPDEPRGSMSDLISRDDIVGRMLRTQGGVAPVYVSVGHRIALDTACDWVLRLAPRYRLPETTRAADRLSRTG
jgi:deoxyribonuclease V